MVAQELLGLTAAGRQLQVPGYITEAIVWLTDQPDEQVPAPAEPEEGSGS